jgi:ankyrin repeat protein
MKRYFMKRINQIVFLLFLFFPCSFYAMWTPLHQAAIDGNLEQAQNFLDRGADVNVKNNNGWTPLYCAAMKNDENSKAIINLLLDKGADVNAADMEGWTPLHIAAAYNSKELVLLFLDRGANVNVKHNNGWTPLYYAAGNGYKEIVQLLLEKGAKVNAADNNGLKPLHVAKCSEPRTA